MSYVATTIKAQIRAGDPMALALWGARDFISLLPTRRGGRGGSGVTLGGLSFDVAMPGVRRRVAVRLASDDTYTVETGRVHKLQYQRRDVRYGITCEQLASTIEALLAPVTA